MLFDRYQLEQTQKRYAERTDQRHRNERLIEQKRPLEVDTPERVQKFLKRRGMNITVEGKPVLEDMSKVLAGEVAGLSAEIGLERQIGSSDLMGIAFLEEGLRVARTVARIWVNVAGGRPSAYGTGFMISPRLLLTNHHVLGDPAIAHNSLAEFDYQRRNDGSLGQSVSFALDPGAFFYADRELDYACVAVRAMSSEGRPLSNFGHNTLSEEEGKAIAAQWANIIQHPSGEPKQLSLRENQIVDVLPQYLHYKTDTAPGSSGSPVFNDRWEVVALHHSGIYAKTPDGRPATIDGTPWQDGMGEDRIKWISNEGVRISRLIAHLRGQLRSDAHRQMFEEIIMPAQPGSPIDRDTSHGSFTTSERNAPSPANDGSVTWTIPITVTVNVGGAHQAALLPAGPAGPIMRAPQPVSPPAPAQPVAGIGSSPNEILNAARAAFARRSNVMNVRLGYVFTDGRITKERALVVTTRKKMSNSELRAANIEELPASFGGLKVQVTDPTIEELIIANTGFAAREALGVNIDALAAEITYKPPAAPGLARVKAQMTVNAHLSPDAGWKQLSDFLGGTRKTLSVGMYDFGARHIADVIKSIGDHRTFKGMVLTLQPGQSVGSGTKENDLTDKEAVEELEDALGDKFKIAWIKIGLVNGWVASSYHIKVAVRDKSSFWLSSGNWQSSNQPPPVVEPLVRPWNRTWLSKYNREWHAIVDHPGLAADFEKYLLHDFANNVGVGTGEAMALPDLLIPEEMFMPSVAERAAPFKYFEPLIETREFDVQPLLTPDNYFEHTLALIKSAREELLIQNQTFNAPKPSHAKLRELLSAVLDKQRAGVDVRIIFRLIMKADARKNLEALQDFGFDMSAIRVQKNCHTKGIVVDRKRVMLGSQNWSEQGVSLNRDASLIFEDEKLANYFAEIFDHDWQALATDNIGSAPSGAELAPAAGPAPEGTVKLSVEEYLETL